MYHEQKVLLLFLLPIHPILEKQQNYLFYVCFSSLFYALTIKNVFLPMCACVSPMSTFIQMVI